MSEQPQLHLSTELPVAAAVIPTGDARVDSIVAEVIDIESVPIAERASRFERARLGLADVLQDPEPTLESIPRD